VQKIGVLSAMLVLVSGAIAGCGSSGSSSSSTVKAAPATSAAPAATAPATAEPTALITTKHAKLGPVLAYGSKRLTVYLFEADKGSHSTCSGTCAKVWPPVVGQPKATGDAHGADLGTIKRADGTTQVTYKGHPLYLFAKDKDDGDTYGQGLKSFGAGWYVLKPSGAKIDES
jgi:predicted lipoprotein with Yx(FWY)xxD motif